jgi:hypothetical protein
MEVNNGGAIWLPCAHVFHKECIQPWVKKNTCPTCRVAIYDPERDVYQEDISESQAETFAQAEPQLLVAFSSFTIIFSIFPNCPFLDQFLDQSLYLSGLSRLRAGPLKVW